MYRVIAYLVGGVLLAVIVWVFIAQIAGPGQDRPASVRPTPAIITTAQPGLPYRPTPSPQSGP